MSLHTIARRYWRRVALSAPAWNVVSTSSSWTAPTGSTSKKPAPKYRRSSARLKPAMVSSPLSPSSHAMTSAPQLWPLMVFEAVAAGGSSRYSSAAEQEVVAVFAFDPVGTVLAVDGVAVAAAPETVVAGATIDDVVTCIAVDGVGAGASVDDIVTAECEDRVVAGTRRPGGYWRSSPCTMSLPVPVSTRSMPIRVSSPQAPYALPLNRLTVTAPGPV